MSRSKIDAQSTEVRTLWRDLCLSFHDAEEKMVYPEAWTNTVDGIANIGNHDKYNPNNINCIRTPRTPRTQRGIKDHEIRAVPGVFKTPTLI